MIQLIKKCNSGGGGDFLASDKSFGYPYDFKNIHSAFTIAEVLITLGIIGIVAAMTLPSVIVNYQKKQTSAQLKKAYSTFAQALLKSQYDNEQSSNWVTTTVSSSYEDNLKYFQTYWQPYLKVIKVCKTMQECGYDSNTKGYKMIAHDNDANNHYGQYSNVPGFIYGDGTYAYIRPYNAAPDAESLNLKLQLLSIDVNGPKNPNTVGKDVFQFEIDITRGVIKGFGSPEFCTKDVIKNDTENARSCGGKVMADGWEFLEDYPW